MRDGLLVGGILAGKSLIRASELRAVGTESQRYATAVNAFRNKYLGVPGDLSNATQFWGLDSTTNCTSNSGASLASPGTCDGDGSGFINSGLSGNATGERFQIWRHMALAGLIEGNYTGTAGPLGLADSLGGINSPASKLGGTFWSAGSSSNFIGNGTWYAMDYGNLFRNAVISGGTGQPDGATLRPAEAWNIDTKMDDGQPAYGAIVARFWNNTCTTAVTGVTSNTNLDARYRLEDDTIQCQLIWRRVF